MADSFNSIFHVFFMAFFIVSAGFFWVLDRRRWADYRQASKAVDFKFLQNANLTKLIDTANIFHFFNAHDLVRFSALCHGKWQNHNFLVFNFFYQGDRSSGILRQGFACTLVECQTSLPEMQLWQEEPSCPFGEDTPSLEGFFHDSALTQHFRIRGRHGLEVHQFLKGKVGRWLLENQIAAMETKGNHILLARKAEWQPLELKSDLERVMVLIRLVENRQSVAIASSG